MELPERSQVVREWFRKVGLKEARLKLLTLCMLGLSTHLHAYGTLPDNSIAVSNCTATVHVDAARLRAEPSLDATILGLRLQEEPVFVTKICGKWAQVVTERGDTAYMAAYLLTFPAHEILEQWKKEVPAPTVGKKAKVKWAKVNFRQYPSASSRSLGHFKFQENLSVLSNLKAGWSLVESRDTDGKSIAYGFVATKALKFLPAFPALIFNQTLAIAHQAPKKMKEPVYESPGQYAARTAWSPEVFALELKEKTQKDLEIHKLDFGQKRMDLLAVR